MKWFYRFIKENWIEFILFFFWFLVYAATSSRSVVQGDTGEFLATAAIGGVPHDPGYPLLSIITRIAYLLPFGHPVLQINLTSAIFAALAVVVVFKIVRLITNDLPSALFGALSLATYESFWFYALVVQVHVLQVMLFALIFYSLALAIKTKKEKYLYLAAFFLGLGVSNHQTIIFTLPGILIVVWHLRKTLNLKKLGIMLIISIAGLLPYCYTIIIAATKPIINWGGVHNLQSFIYFFFRGDYGTFNLANPEPWAPFRYSPIVFYFQNILTTSWYIVIFAIASTIYLVKKDIFYSVLSCTFILVGPLYYLIAAIPVRYVVHQANIGQFLQYSFIFISIFAGLGVSLIAKKFFPKYTIPFTFLVFLFFILPFCWTFSKVNLNGYSLTQKTTEFELSELPKNGVLLLWSDSLYMPSFYLQYLGKYRPDVTIIQLGLFNLDWYRQNLKQYHPQLKKFLVSKNFNYDGICESFANQNKLFLYPWYPEFDKSFKNCVIIPYGLISKVVPKDKAPSLPEIKNANDNFWKKYISQFPSINIYKNQYARIRETLFYVAEHLSFTGIYYLRFGRFDLAYNEFKLAREFSPDETNSIINESAILYTKGEYAKAIQVINEGIKRNSLTPDLYKNLGFIYLKLNKPDKAYENFKLYLQFNPVDDSLPQINNFIMNYLLTHSS